MIETKILGSAVGVQRGNVIDNSETTTLPSLGNGVITGKFKRGRTDKPFKVTSDNFRALLGHEPNNPSYMAVEDAFKRGISEVQVLRVGSSSSASGGGAGGGNDMALLPVNQSITINNSDGNYNNYLGLFSIDIDGLMFNEDKTKTLDDIPSLKNTGLLRSFSDSSGNITFYTSSQTPIEVKLSPSAEQKTYSNSILFGEGLIKPNGDFLFKLIAPPA